MEELLNNPEVQKAIGALFAGILLMALDTAYQTIKGVEHSGSGAAKEAVSKQTTWARPWTKAIVGLLRAAATVTTKSGGRVFRQKHPVYRKKGDK